MPYRLEAVGVLGGESDAKKDAPVEDAPANGSSENGVEASEVNGSKDSDSIGGSKFIRGVVNDISFFERGDRAADRMCVVVVVGKEHRLGQSYISRAVVVVAKSETQMKAMMES